MPLTGIRPAFFGAVGLYLSTASQRNWTMTADEALGYVEAIGQHSDAHRGSVDAGLPTPPGLYVAGAEPMAQLPDLERILDCAKLHRMPVELVTSAYWVDSLEIAEAVLDRLRTRVHLLTITTRRSDVDSYGLAAIDLLLQAIRRFDISIQILVTVGPEEPFPKELLALEVVNSDSTVIRIEPMYPNDRSQLSPQSGAWPEGFLMESPPRHARCAELLGFVITPGGDVYPCSNGIGFPELLLGNMTTHTIVEMLDKALAGPQLNKLREEGPYFLFDDFRRSLPLEVLPAGYVSSCDFHRQVMARNQQSASRVDSTA